jgi:enamine deaminase RidA (YjgF/YER057c/UK114 family)
MDAPRLGSTVEPLLPVTIPKGDIRYAPGIKAGRWIFATGHKGTADYVSGMAAGVLQPALPHWGKPKLRREADQIFENLRNVLKAGGSDLENIVRVDQNYTTSKAVEPYHDARRAALGEHVPPSTSTLTQGLLLESQAIEVHAIGIVPDAAFQPVHIRPVQQREVHPSSGYSLAVAAGDFVFVAGRMADSFEFGGGVAGEARMPDGYLWKGMPIKLEAEFVIRKKIIPALESAGSSLRDAVKCQVYMRDPDDFAPFNEVWSSHFPEGMPATTLIPTATPGFSHRDLRLEINVIALKSGGQTRSAAVHADFMPSFQNHTHAMHAGDLLLISGMLAIDRAGLIADARSDSEQPFFGSSIDAQMDALLARAHEVCRGAKTSLANVVRIQQYHTSLRDFYGAYQVWERHLPDRHLPLSAIEVPFLPVPGCTVMLELWVYAPDT